MRTKLVTLIFLSIGITLTLFVFAPKLAFAGQCSPHPLEGKWFNPSIDRRVSTVSTSSCWPTEETLISLKFRGIFGNQKLQSKFSWPAHNKPIHIVEQGADFDSAQSFVYLGKLPGLIELGIESEAAVLGFKLDHYQNDAKDVSLQELQLRRLRIKPEYHSRKNGDLFVPFVDCGPACLAGWNANNVSFRIWLRNGDVKTVHANRGELQDNMAHWRFWYTRIPENWMKIAVRVEYADVTFYHDWHWEDYPVKLSPLPKLAEAAR